MCIRRFSASLFTAISRELAEAKIHVNLTSAKSRFKRPKFKRSRNSAKSSSRKNRKNIRKNCGRDESTRAILPFFFLRATVLEQKDYGGFFSRRRNRARLSWTGGCGFFFISLVSISQFERFNFITMDVRWGN